MPWEKVWALRHPRWEKWISAHRRRKVPPTSGTSPAFRRRSFDPLEVEATGGGGPVDAIDSLDDQGLLQHRKVEGGKTPIDPQLLGDLLRGADAIVDRLQDGSPHPQLEDFQGEPVPFGRIPPARLRPVPSVGPPSGGPTSRSTEELSSGAIYDHLYRKGQKGGGRGRQF